MQNLSIYIFVLLTAWLFTLSFFLYRFFAVYKKLTQNVGVGDIKKILEKILSHGDENTKTIKEIIKRLDLVEEKDKSHIQKVSLIKFNPFNELGGEHSFCLAILDDRNTGVVITGLHARERTRIYVKDIKNGKSSLELSVEERKALDNAQRSK